MSPYCKSAPFGAVRSCWTVVHSTQPLCGDMASANDEEYVVRCRLASQYTARSGSAESSVDDFDTCRGDVLIRAVTILRYIESQPSTGRFVILRAQLQFDFFTTFFQSALLTLCTHHTGRVCVCLWCVCLCAECARMSVCVCVSVCLCVTCTTWSVGEIVWCLLACLFACLSFARARASKCQLLSLATLSEALTEQEREKRCARARGCLRTLLLSMPTQLLTLCSWLW